MNQRHYAFWPRRRPYSFPVPVTNLALALRVSAERYPAHPAIVFYDSPISYKRLWREVEAFAGCLESVGVRRGDRVLLCMQNSPSFVVAYYGILRANAVVVPLNPMVVAEEFAVYIEDSGARVAVAGAEVYERLAPFVPAPLETVIVASYRSYLEVETGLTLPPAVAAPAPVLEVPGFVAFDEALAAGKTPGPVTTGENDIAVLPYTSGTTGRPKGCVHTHRSITTTAVSNLAWGGIGSGGGRTMSVLPYFHVTGMTVDMNATLFAGGTIVMLSRWDPAAAIALIERYRCDAFTAISTMVVDMLANPEFKPGRVSSLRHLGGGGAALPKAVGEQLRNRLGLTYIEGYGLTETIATTHANPVDRPKLQCLGIPIFGVDSRILDPESLRELGPNETGEIVTHGSQVMREYWNQPEATAEAFVEFDGKRFLRTGDLGYYDDDGYFFMVDRLKRMVNASGFKVWPAEVEAKLFAHPAVKEACVIGSADPRKGQIVKAIVVLREGERASAEELIAWARDHMAAYKVPGAVEFRESLPRSGTGKVQWRVLQEEEDQRNAAPAAR